MAYRPPDQVLLALGAAFRTEALVAAARRLLPLVEADLTKLQALGIEKFAAEDLTALIEETSQLHADKRTKGKDTPLQMNQLAELMAQVRAWLRTLRSIASINLACDTPALLRIATSAPELKEGYPRDLLAELDRIVSAARDLRPRLEDAGLSESFVGRGARLAQQLRTAIGQKDLDGKDLTVSVRRLYMRKAELYLLEKRLVRAAEVVFMSVPARRSLYHLEEIEPQVDETIVGQKG